MTVYPTLSVEATDLFKFNTVDPHILMTAAQFARFVDCLRRVTDCFCLNGSHPYSPDEREFAQVLRLTERLYTEIDDMRYDLYTSRHLHGEAPHDLDIRISKFYTRWPRISELQQKADEEVLRDWNVVLDEVFMEDEEEQEEEE